MIDSRFSPPCKDSQPCVATIGFFDGLHRGHRCLIDQVIQLAKQRGLSSAVVTFPVHPRQVMSPDYAPHLLTPFERKMALLMHDSGMPEAAEKRIDTLFVRAYNKQER